MCLCEGFLFLHLRQEARLSGRECISAVTICTDTQVNVGIPTHNSHHKLTLWSDDLWRCPQIYKNVWSGTDTPTTQPNNRPKTLGLKSDLNILRFYKFSHLEIMEGSEIFMSTMRHTIQNNLEITLYNVLK